MGRLDLKFKPGMSRPAYFLICVPGLARPAQKYFVPLISQNIFLDIFFNISVKIRTFLGVKGYGSKELQISDVIPKSLRLKGVFFVIPATPKTVFFLAIQNFF